MFQLKAEPDDILAKLSIAEQSIIQIAKSRILSAGYPDTG